jgi:hypothetical protein
MSFNTSTLMMKAETVSKTLDVSCILTSLITIEYFIATVILLKTNLE